MANIGGYNSAFEIELRKKLSALDKQIKVHTDNIENILTDAIKFPEAGKRYWNKVSAQIDVEYKALEKLITTWNAKEIPEAYRKSLAEITKRLNRSKAIASRAQNSLTVIANNSKSNAITSQLVKDANIDIVLALTNGQANVERLLRRTQQALVQESFLNTEIAKAIKDGNLSKAWYNGAKDPAIAAQMKKTAELIDGQYYVQAGSRKYTVDYYTEMVARTKFHEAQAYAAINTADNYGTDLVQVSNHNTDTEICLQHENKIYSIGGKDKRFPILDTIPPYHPNCLHLLSPTFAEAMEVQGNLDDWSKFSKGTSQIPPSPSNWVPADEREVV